MKKQLCALLACAMITPMGFVVQANAAGSEPVNTAYTVPVSPNVDYNMNIGWKFCKPDYMSDYKTVLSGYELTTPDFNKSQIHLNYADSLEYVKQKYGNGEYNFYDVDFDDSSWETISVPHTYNDDDIFDGYANGSGEAVERGMSFYRKHFTLDEKHNGQKIFVEFEGIRQSAYVWVNGIPVGKYELGVDPFGFDITAAVNYGGDNVIAVANDSSSGGNFYGTAQKETRPGSAWGAWDGIGTQWNSAGFNPVLGGLTRNVILHTKNDVYQTLPLYSNLKTTGAYIYGSDWDIENKSATINVEAEVRNESEAATNLKVEVAVVDKDGNLQWQFETDDVTTVPVAADKGEAFLDIVAADAYNEEDGLTTIEPTDTSTVEVKKIKASAQVSGMRFWSPDDPYLYDVYTILKDESDNILDVTKTSTGFRKVEAKGGTDNGGTYINDKYYYLKGYAQRATNEWAAIGTSTDWLDDYDMALLRESNGNFVRWMHIAAQPADVRACDKYGIVIVQPAGDGEGDTVGRQWDQRVEVMRDTIIYFRNNPSIVFWECGNNKVTAAHMKEMTDLRKLLDPNGGRVMGSRAMGGESADDVQGVEESEYVATMLGRSLEDDNGFRAWAQDTINKRAIVESEYYREEAPRRVWDNYSAPWYDYVHNPTRSGKDADAWDLTSEEFVTGSVKAYNHYYGNRVNSNSSRQTYSAAAMLCWTDSMQHGRIYNTENARMSGRVDPVRIKKQSFYANQAMQSEDPAVYLVGHWNYSDNASDYPAGIDPTNKTVYVVASNVKYVELYVDGVSQGKCVSPTDGFLYTFTGIDVTKTGGYIEAVGYNTKGEALARHKIETAGAPTGIRLTPTVGPNGLLADGSDVAFFDVEVVDSEGRVIPDNYSKLELSVTGNATLKGGYNSGCYSEELGNSDQAFPNQKLNNDPTVVYAECGTNRVFVRATDTPGSITLNVNAPELGLSNSATITSTAVSTANGLTTVMPQSVINANIEPRKEQAAPTQSAMNPLMRVARVIFGEGGNASTYVEEDTRNHIKVFVDDKEVEGIDAYEMAQSVFGNLSKFADAVGATVTPPAAGADLNNALITITKGDKTVYLKGSKIVDENDQELATINQIAQWVDGELYAELSALTVRLGLIEDAQFKTGESSYSVLTGPRNYSFTLDMTGLTASDYNANDYTAVNASVSIKADPANFVNDGISLKKDNNVRIKIVPKANGTITVTCSGGAAVMPVDRENRNSSDTAITSGTPISVEAGKAYYLQGSASTAAKITQIIFTQDAE